MSVSRPVCPPAALLTCMMQRDLSPSNPKEKETRSVLLIIYPPTSPTASDNEHRGDVKEPKKLHPVVQNGLYVAEMFAAHIARQNVISFVVDGELRRCCSVKLIIRARRVTTSSTSGILTGKIQFNALASTSFRICPAFWSCCLLCSE